MQVAHHADEIKRLMSGPGSEIHMDESGQILILVDGRASAVTIRVVSSHVSTPGLPRPPV